MSKNAKPFLLSVIVPVHDESAGLRNFHTKLTAVLSAQAYTYELIYVDDGSHDDSPAIIKSFATKNKAVKPLYLSRNFGKEQATSAGLHASKGNAAIMLDADGQHPVTLLPKFVAKWQAGTPVVIGVRLSNQKEGFVKRYGSKLFYHCLRLLGVRGIVPGATDFRLVDREVINQFNRLHEHNRITRSLIDWLGYEREIITFHANQREAGEASYSFRKLVQLALNGFVSLSFLPLYFSGYLGIFIMVLSFVGSIFAVVEKYIMNDPLQLNISGTAILAVFVLFLVGILLACQGLLAVYIARIYIEVQGRPLYTLKEK